MGGLGFYARDDIKASEKRAELNAYCTGDLEVWDLEIWDLEIWDLEVWDLEIWRSDLFLALGSQKSWKTEKLTFRIQFSTGDSFICNAFSICFGVKIETWIKVLHQ